MKRTGMIIFCAVALVLLLSSCVEDRQNSPGIVEDNPPLALPPQEQLLPMEAETPPAPAMTGEIANLNSKPAYIDSDYLLLVEIYRWLTDEYEYVFLGQDIRSATAGKEYGDAFIAQYGKDTRTRVGAISADGQDLVFWKNTRVDDYEIEAYQGSNLIFTCTYPFSGYEVDNYWFNTMSEMEAAFSSEDYGFDLAYLLFSWGNPYPVAKTMMDIDANTEIKYLPWVVSDDCSAYLLVDYRDDGAMYHSLYSYPGHELISSFILPYSQTVSSSLYIDINQLLDQRQMIYTMWDTNTSYLYDVSNHTAVQLGTGMLYPQLSPDKKYLAYARQDWESTSSGIYILDNETQETQFFPVACGLGNSDELRIIGWTEAASIRNAAAGQPAATAGAGSSFAKSSIDAAASIKNQYELEHIEEKLFYHQGQTIFVYADAMYLSEDYGVTQRQIAADLYPQKTTQVVADQGQLLFICDDGIYKSDFACDRYELVFDKSLKLLAQEIMGSGYPLLTEEDLADCFATNIQWHGDYLLFTPNIPAYFNSFALLYSLKLSDGQVSFISDNAPGYVAYGDQVYLSGYSADYDMLRTLDFNGENLQYFYYDCRIELQVENKIYCNNDLLPIWEYDTETEKSVFLIENPRTDIVNICYDGFILHDFKEGYFLYPFASGQRKFLCEGFGLRIAVAGAHLFAASEDGFKLLYVCQ